MAPRQQPTGVLASLLRLLEALLPLVSHEAVPTAVNVPPYVQPQPSHLSILSVAEHM
jgi:hypothetical protein